MAAAPLSLLFSSLHVFSPSHTLSYLLSTRHAFLLAFLSTILQHMKGTIGPEIMPLIVALVVLPLSLVVGYCHKWQYPNSIQYAVSHIMASG